MSVACESFGLAMELFESLSDGSHADLEFVFTENVRVLETCIDNDVSWKDGIERRGFLSDRIRYRIRDPSEEKEVFTGRWVWSRTRRFVEPSPMTRIGLNRGLILSVTPDTGLKSSCETNEMSFDNG